MTNQARHIAHVILTLVTAVGIARAREPKIATKLHPDSTIFKLKLEPGLKPMPGKTFKVHIHVSPNKPFRVWSSAMSDDGGLFPLKISVPDSIVDFFELTGFKELGKPEIAYDSNFQQVTKSFSEPFDLVATIKIKKNSSSPKPFYLWVTYGCDDGKSRCIPPTKYNVPMDVIWDEPVMIKIASNIPKSKVPNKLLAINSL